MVKTAMKRLVGPAIYSAQDERALTARYLGGRAGFFVEVGAYDPLFQSQTHHLEMTGWNGLLVEPVPEFADNLRRNRRAAVRQCACVSPGAAAAGHVALLHRRGNSTTHFNPRRARADNQVIDVPAATLDSLLEEAGVHSVDFLSIDVVGAEPDVLRGINLSRTRPRLVLVDDRNRFAETCRVLRDGAYRLVRRTGHNAWFVPREAPFPLSVRGWVQLTWTYGIGRLMRRGWRAGAARSGQRQTHSSGIA